MAAGRYGRHDALIRRLVIETVELPNREAGQAISAGLHAVRGASRHGKAAWSARQRLLWERKHPEAESWIYNAGDAAHPRPDRDLSG